MQKTQRPEQEPNPDFSTSGAHLHNPPVVVTGASGHIGANLVRALLDHGRRVRVLVHKNAVALDGLPVEIVHADLLDGASVLRACTGTGTVFHLAGKISAGWESDADVQAINVTGTRHVIEACLAAGVRRLVHFSSIQALSCSRWTNALDETCDLVASNDPARGAYDRAKAEAEGLVKSAAERGLEAVVLNPTGVLGPFDFQRSPMGEVLAALGRGKLPALVAGGSCDFVDVRDVVTGALAAEQNGRPGERYILSGTRLSLVELAAHHRAFRCPWASQDWLRPLRPCGRAGAGSGPCSPRNPCACCARSGRPAIARPKWTLGTGRDPWMKPCATPTRG